MLHVFKDLSFTFKIASGLLVINKVGGITLGVPTGTSVSSAPLQAVTVSPALWADGGSLDSTSSVTLRSHGISPGGTVQPALRTVFMYLTAVRDNQRTGPPQ